MSKIIYNKFLREITDWFSLIKAPDLKSKIVEAVELVESGGQLADNQKKLLAFCCFSYSMNRGPASFIGVEMVVEGIDVKTEFEEYAKDWINHNKTKTEQP